MRLKMKHIAFAAIAFGLSASTTLAQEQWPNLPVGIKNGISARIGDTLYVGLGSAGSDLYALNLGGVSKGWVKRAAFIGPATNGAVAAVSGGRLYLFGGNGKSTPDAKSPIIFESVYAYDPAKDQWDAVETKTPTGLSGAKGLSMPDGRIAIVGGYNKQLFDKYLADVSGIDKDREPDAFKALVNTYMGMKPQEYRWNTKVLVYDPSANSWGTLGDNPYLPNCDSALAAWKGSYVLVSGEVKPGLRTSQVKSIRFDAGGAIWEQLADLPALSDSEPQEGVAGAYAATVGDALIVAGGANFKGARANGEAGKWFAHDGLKKSWRSDIYALSGGTWKTVGSLPRGLAYGASFALPDGLLIAGGEDADGKARTEVLLLRWDGTKLSVAN